MRTQKKLNIKGMNSVLSQNGSKRGKMNRYHYNKKGKYTGSSSDEPPVSGGASLAGFVGLFVLFLVWLTWPLIIWVGIGAAVIGVVAFFCNR